MKIHVLVGVVGFFLAQSSAWAWSNHALLTRLALQAYEWSDAPPQYEVFENVLADLKGADGRIYANREEFEKAIQIQPEKIQWAWRPPSNSAVPDPLEIIGYSDDETDQGMDQNLNLSPDQKFMGGFTGPSSQGYRHMFYEAWSVLEPFATFHYPFHEMGEAPRRAALFFQLAKQLKKTGHLFWAYRFLGFGLHYVQDLTQPYHASQLGSLKIAAWKKLFIEGTESFINETTRIVANFHLAFEEYTLYLLDPERGSYLSNAFKIPKGDELLKVGLDQNADLTVEQGVRMIAHYTCARAPSVVKFEGKMMGVRLKEPAMNLVDGFRDASGSPKVDFRELESDPRLEPARNSLRHVMFDTLSNAGVATRWYIDRFRKSTDED